jgi:hypothetical protein
VRRASLFRRTAATAEEATLRHIPDLPSGWQEPPTMTSEHDFPELRVPASMADFLRAREPGRAQECTAWHAEQPHDQHAWHDADHGRVLCPGLRPSPDMET